VDLSRLRENERVLHVLSIEWISNNGKLNANGWSVPLTLKPTFVSNQYQ